MEEKRFVTQRVAKLLRLKKVDVGSSTPTVYTETDDYFNERILKLEEHVEKRAAYLKKVVETADRQPDNYDDTATWTLASDDFEPFDTTYGADIDWCGVVNDIINITAIAYWKWNGKDCPSPYIADLMSKTEKNRLFFSEGYFVDRYSVKDEGWRINIIDAIVTEEGSRYLFFSIDDNCQSYRSRCKIIKKSDIEI